MFGLRYCHQKFACLIARNEAVFLPRLFMARITTSTFPRLVVSAPPTATAQLLPQQYLQGRQHQNLICREYSKKAEKLTVDDVRTRVLKVCAAFDKINAEKLTIESHFMNDLGLDSLDHVEVIMAIEDEFGFEIPDSDAEKLLKPSDIARYVADKKEATA